MSYFKECITEHIQLFEQMVSLESEVKLATDMLADTITKGGKLIFCGNGGSAADCQHIAAEFIGRFINDRKPLPAIALTTDTSILTCVSNDYSFNDVFSRQVEALGKPEDCLIGISTSGNSQNVLEAIKSANKMGIKTIGLLGRNGGMVSKNVTHSIIVPSENTARIQEAHIMLGHILCGGVEHLLDYDK